LELIQGIHEGILGNLSHHLYNLDQHRVNIVV